MNNRLQQFLELENLTPSQLADKLGVQRSGLSHILSGRNKPGYDFISKLLTKFPTINAEWVITGKGKIYKEVTPPSPSNSNNFGSSNFHSNPSSSKNSQYQNENSNFRNRNFDAILDDAQNLENENSLDHNFSNQNIYDNNLRGENSNIENLSNNSNYNQKIEEFQKTEDHQKHFTDENQKNSENDASSLFFGDFLESSTEESSKHISPNSPKTTNNKQFTANNSTPQLNKSELNKQNSTVAQKKRTIKRVIVFYSDGSFEELFPNR